MSRCSNFRWMLLPLIRCLDSLSSFFTRPYWLSRKNCCVPGMGLVTTFRPFATKGPGRLAVQIGEPMANDKKPPRSGMLQVQPFKLIFVPLIRCFDSLGRVSLIIRSLKRAYAASPIKPGSC